MRQIYILLIEDSRTDALLVESVLANEPTMNITHVERLVDGLALLSMRPFDVVLTDLGLPDSQGLATFEQLKKQMPQLPIIIFTIEGDMDTAMVAIQGGAQDYLPKSDLSEALIVRSIRYAIERKRLMQQLQESLEQVKTLRGMLPICASCKKVRDDGGYWDQIESYITRHTKVLFTHGLCPDCINKYF